MVGVTRSKDSARPFSALRQVLQAAIVTVCGCRLGAVALDVVVGDRVAPVVELFELAPARRVARVCRLHDCPNSEPKAAEVGAERAGWALPWSSWRANERFVASTAAVTGSLASTSSCAASVCSPRQYAWKCAHSSTT